MILRLENERIELKVTSPVTVSTAVDERSGRPVVDQAKKTPKTKKNTERTERPVVEGTGRLVKKIPNQINHDRTGQPVVCRLRSRKF